MKKKAKLTIIKTIQILIIIAINLEAQIKTDIKKIDKKIINFIEILVLKIICKKMETIVNINKKKLNKSNRDKHKIKKENKT